LKTLLGIHNMSFNPDIAICIYYELSFVKRFAVYVSINTTCRMSDFWTVLSVCVGFPFIIRHIINSQAGIFSENRFTFKFAAFKIDCLIDFMVVFFLYFI